MRVRGTCSVLGCPNKGVHKLPANETVRLQWIKVMRLDRQRKVGWNLRRYSRVCSDHFQESDFVYLDFSKWDIRPVHLPLRRLKKNAVPSIFPWTTCEEGKPSYISSFNPRLVIKTYAWLCLQRTFEEEISFTETIASDGDPLSIGLDKYKNHGYLSEDWFPSIKAEHDGHPTYLEVKIEPGGSEQCARNEMKLEKLSTSKKYNKYCGLLSNNPHSVKVGDDICYTQK